MCAVGRPRFADTVSAVPTPLEPTARLGAVVGRCVRSSVRARLAWRRVATRAPAGLAGRGTRRGGGPPGCAGSCGPGRRSAPAARRGRQRLPRAGHRPAGDRGRGGRGPHLGRGLDRVAAGHRQHRAARRAGGGAGRVLRDRGGAGVLLRLRGQPRRADRAVRAGHADRLRRGQPRLAGRRLPALPGPGRGRAARRPGRGRRRAGRPRRGPGAGRHRERGQHRRADRPAAAAARGGPGPRARCWWSTRRTGSGCAGRAGAGSWPRSGWPAPTTWWPP